MVWAILGAFSFSTAAEKLKVDGLEYLERRQKIRKFSFKARNDPTYAIQIESRANGKISAFYKVGDLIEERFLIKGIEEKRAHLADISELTILDQRTGRSLVIALKDSKLWPDYYAEFRFKGVVSHVQERNPFKLKGHGWLKVLEVNEDDVLIAEFENEKKTIRIKKTAKEN